jgi:hypothetical protein
VRRARQGLAACRSHAHQLFADDRAALVSFNQRLDEIEGHVRQRGFAEAFQVAEQQRQQLEILALASAASGHLPEYAEKLRQFAAMMTRFDFCVGNLCEATFADRGSPTLTIMFGMLSILESAFVAELPEGETPGSLLEGKAAQNKKAAAEIADCTQVVEILSC